jgi:hypothetical protein
MDPSFAGYPMDPVRSWHDIIWVREDHASCVWQSGGMTWWKLMHRQHCEPKLVNWRATPDTVRELLADENWPDRVPAICRGHDPVCRRAA